MTKLRQASFAGGEIAPSLWGRSDHERYGISLRGCRNFFITPQGGALNRPGTKFIAATKDSTKHSRLVPFIVDDDETFVLEFGDSYVRFFKNGVPVGDGEGGLYEVATSYAEAELPFLKFAQVGDVLSIAHSAHVPAELTHSGDTSWALADVSFALPAMYSGGTEPVLDAISLPTEDGTHPAQEWIWKVTTIAQDKITGATFESLPNIVSDTVDLDAGYPGFASHGPVPQKLPVYIDKKVRIGWPTTGGLISQPDGWDEADIVGFRIYRGRGKTFGLIGETGYGPDEATLVREFVDVGDSPDYFIQPPAARNPFEVYKVNVSGTRSLDHTEHPSAVGFFDQRQVFAATTQRPGWLWASRVNDFSNFDFPLLSTPDSSVEFELASLRREQTRSVIAQDRLFLFSMSGVWTMSGVQGPLTRENVQAIKHTDEGASWVTPIVTGGQLLYVRSKAVGVNMLDYDNRSGKYQPTDIGIFAHHLFETGTIVEWAYAHDPYRIVWVVRSDGALLSLTFHHEQQTLAWAQHSTEGGAGFFESVCAVPEGQFDAVYVVVRRTVNGVTRRYVERLEPRPTTTTFVDCATTDTGTNLDTVSDVGHLEGKTVTAIISKNGGGTFAKPGLTVVGGEVALGLLFADGETSAISATVGLPYQPELELLDLANPKVELKGLAFRVTRAFIDVVASRGLLIGEDFTRLTEWRQRQVGDSYMPVPPATGLVEVGITAGWNRGGRVVLRQVDPFPLAVFGVTREVTSGG